MTFKSTLKKTRTLSDVRSHKSGEILCYDERFQVNCWMYAVSYVFNILANDNSYSVKKINH